MPVFTWLDARSCRPPPLRSPHSAAIATVYEARPNLEKLEWEQWDPESEDEESEEDGVEAEYMY